MGIFLFMNFWVRKVLFSLFSKQPPTLRTGGKLLRVKEWKYRITIFSHTHLGFILGYRQGEILPCQKLWGQIHSVDHIAVGKGPRCTRVHKHFSYPSHKVGYQGLWATFGTQIPRFPTKIHPGRDGVPKHLLAWHDILIRYQNQEKVHTKEVRLWIFKYKEKMTKPRWGDSRQPLDATRKKCHEVEEGHMKVVWVPKESHP